MADNTLLNNVDFSFRRGSKANFNRSAFKNGSLNICMDTDEFYADIDDRRIPLSGIVIYDTETEIFALENPEPVIYYAISTNQLYHYDPVNLNWTYLTDGTANPDTVGFITNAVSSGNHSIIFYKANGSTFAVNTQDLDTTYSTGNSTYSGLSKLYSGSGNRTDGTITQKAITELLAGKVSTEDGKAPQAVADNKGNVIDQTYIKNVLANGRIVTFTRGDGSTFSISTQDTNDNTTYSGGNSTYAGLTRLYKEVGNKEDGTMTQKAIKQALDGKMSTGATAYGAEFDGKGQNIANTYIKSITQNSLDGHVFTITWGNGNTTNIETVDNNTTYSEATASNLGLVKLYSSLGVNMDGTMTQAALYSAFNSKMNVGDTAIAAIHDSAEQQIDTTYIKNVNVNGQTVTFTRGDNSTFSIVTQDTKVDESTIATSASAGFVMLYPSTGGSTIGAINQKATTDLLETKLATTATAVRAKADAEGQNISETYIKNAQITGTKVTFTRGNGSTFKVTTQDNNTTYAQAVVDSNKEGLVKLYSSTGSNTDGSITQKKVSEDLLNIKNNGLVGATFSSNINRITMEKGNGSTFKFDLNNTTYAQATSTTLGLTKIYGGTGNNLDGSIDQKNLTDLLNGKLSTVGTAYAANNDGNNHNIANTYIKGADINGKVITFTKGDGSTFTITTQDNNTTYATGNTANTGLTKLYTTTGTNTDGTIRQKELSTILTDLSDNKLGSSATAVAAVKDNKNQVIDSTYLKNAQIDGTTVTFTKGDGSTFNIITQDTNDNSTYSVGSSTYSGLTRLYSTTGTNTNGTIRQSELSTLINGKLNSTATAVAANKDNKNQVIDSTYIKNATVDGRVVTFTRGDGSTFTIITQDTNDNSTYSIGTSTSAGLTKLYTGTGTNTDGSMTQSAIKSALDGKLNSTATAASATKDSGGNTINTTYIKNAEVSGKVVTFTKGDGSTFTITTQDNNTTYATGTTAVAGLTKLYTTTGTNTDGTMTQSAIKSQLDGKLSTSGTAAAATKDSGGNTINTTYIKNASVSGKVVTFTKGDGSTFTISTQDNNTTYGSATSSSEGLVKIYSSTGSSTDGTMTRKAISDAITNGTVNKAKYDTSDNQIDEYVKNIVKSDADPNQLIITRGDGTTFAAYISSTFSTSNNGLVPSPNNASTNYYLRSNGTWGQLPNLSTASAGITPRANAGTFSFLRGDGTWASFNTIGYNNLIKDISLAGDDIEDDIIVTRNDGSIYTINLSNYGSEDVEDEDPESVVNMSKDFMITRQGGVKQILSVGEYGEESDDLDDIADYGSEDDDEILDHTDSATQYTYNGSTYNYRLGEYSRKTYNQIDRVNVVNNSTFTKAAESDPDVEFNSTDIYAERIKITTPVEPDTTEN